MKNKKTKKRNRTNRLLVPIFVICLISLFSFSMFKLAKTQFASYNEKHLAEIMKAEKSEAIIKEAGITSEDGIYGIDSLEKLKEALITGGTIYLSSNIDVTEELQVTVPTKLVSEGDNQYTITRGDSYLENMIVVNKGSLVLENIILDGGKNKNIQANGCILGLNSGKVFIGENAIVRNNYYYYHNGSSYYGSGVSLVGDSTLKMYGGEIADNVITRYDYRSYGAAIYLDKGSSFYMEDGTLKNNSAIMGGEGGAIYSYYGTIEITGGNIIDNTATLYGGAIVNEGGTLNISNANVTNNKALQNENTLNFNMNGGAIYNLNNGTVNITNSEFINNTVEGTAETITGGSIASNGGIVNISKTKFSNNTAINHKQDYMSWGGSLAAFSGAVINFDDSTVSYSEADYGGGVYVSAKGSQFNMKSGKFEYNLAHHQGGGMFVWDEGTIQIDAGYITHNKCDATPTTYKSNFGAGGIMVEEDGNLILGKTVISDNKVNDTGEEAIKPVAVDKYGVAIAGCPTSDINLSLANFAIFDNEISSSSEADVSVATREGAKLVLSDSMIGGGNFNWEGKAPDSVFYNNINEEGSEDDNTAEITEKIANVNTELNAAPSNGDKQLALADATVFIMYNETSAAGGGAAIGTNGRVTGSDPIIISKEVTEGVEIEEGMLFDFNIYLDIDLGRMFVPYVDYEIINTNGNIVYGEVVNGTDSTDELNPKSKKGSILLAQAQVGKVQNSNSEYYGKQGRLINFKLAKDEVIIFTPSDKCLKNDYNSEGCSGLEDSWYYRNWGEKEVETGYKKNYCWTYNCNDVIYYVEENLPDENWKVEWFDVGEKGTYFDPTTETQKQRKVSNEQIARNTGLVSLIVKKDVTEGLAYDANELFYFTLTLTDTKGNPYVGTVDYKLGRGFGDVENGTTEDESKTSTYTSVNGKITFTLSPKQEILFYGIPAGYHYVIEELYTSKQMQGGWKAPQWNNNEDGNTIVGNPDDYLSGEPGSTTTWTAMNWKEGFKGEISVNKMVTGNDGEKDRNFEFEVLLDDKTVNGKYGDMDFVNGEAIFTLKDGESKNATELPSGIIYTINEKEENQDGYVTKATGNIGMVPSTGVSKVTYVNSRNKIVEDKQDIVVNPNTSTFMSIGVVFVIFISFLSLIYFNKKRLEY